MIRIAGSQLSQWDVGRSVSVSDSKATHVHFANQGDSKAPIIKIENGEAKIPDYLLQTGKALNAYAVLDGVTLESRSFAVRKRARPENYVYEEDQRNYLYELITNAENAVANANQAAENANQAAEKCGTDGITPHIGNNGNWFIGETDTGMPSQGEDGADGQVGKDGTSPTVSVSDITGGHRITITDANGTKTVDVMDGADGNTGQDGQDGSDGVGIASIEQTTVSTADGGDNVFTVTLTNGNNAYFTVKNGSKGNTGATGPQGEAGLQGPKGEKGDTGDTGPAGKDGSDYVLTEADKAELVQMVIESLGGNPVFGYVDANNNIIVSGNLPVGTYSVKYEMEDGSTVDIGQLSLSEDEPDEPVQTYTNQIPISTDASGSPFNGGQGWKTGARLSASSGGETAATDYECTGYIPVSKGDILRIKNIDMTSENATNIIFYDGSKTPIACNGANYGTSLAIFFGTADANNVYKGTITGTISGWTAPDNVAFIRIGSKSITADSILTVNQEIV